MIFLFFSLQIGLNMVKRQMKICSTSLIIGELQIKTTMSYHLTPVRMAVIKKKEKKKSTNNKCWRGCGKKEILLYYLWECKLVQPLWKTVRRFLEKLKIELPYDPAILLLSINLEKTVFWKDACTLMFIAMLFAIAKTRKQSKCSITDGWIKKKRYNNGILFSHKRMK